LDEGYEKARKEAEKALELDPNLAEARAIMGWIKMTHDWDWTGANAAYERALELEPTNDDVILGAAWLAAALGRFDEAITLHRRAIEVDPLRVAAYISLGLHTLYAGRLKEVETAFTKALELNPQRTFAHLALGRIYLASSKQEEALAEIQKSRLRIGAGKGWHLLIMPAERRRKQMQLW
jgi:tetratricopeptide (TPR) repeat protein